MKLAEVQIAAEWSVQLLVWRLGQISIVRILDQELIADQLTGVQCEQI